MILGKMGWLNDVFEKKVCLDFTFVLSAVTNMRGCAMLVTSVLISSWLQSSKDLNGSWMIASDL